MSDGPDVACRHCGEPITQGDSGVWSHVIAPGSLLIRCDSAKSGKPYGFEAEPASKDREAER